MKKILICTLVLAVLAACSFNSKQPKDDTYYKRTQGIAWPENK